MDIFTRLDQIPQEINQIDNEKLQLQQRLDAFWEHMPPLNPNFIGQLMLHLQNKIRLLEIRKRELIEEQQELIVRAITLGPRGN